MIKVSNESSVGLKRLVDMMTQQRSLKVNN